MIRCTLILVASLSPPLLHGCGSSQAPVGIALRFATPDGVSEVKHLYIRVSREGSPVPVSGGEKCIASAALSEADGSQAAEFVVPADQEFTVAVEGCDSSGCGEHGCSGRRLWRGETHHARAVEGASKLVDVFMIKVGAVTPLAGEGRAMLRGAAFHSATRLQDGRVLLAGGFISALSPDGTPTSNVQATNNAYLYYPQRGVVEPVSGGMRFKRAMHTAALTPDGMVLIYGGTREAHLYSRSCGKQPVREIASTLTPQVEYFNPLDNTFSELSRYKSFPRAGHSASVLADWVLFAGGRRYQQYGPEVLFCPLLLTKTPQCLEIRATPRFGHTATLFGPSQSQAVLLLGGEDPQSEVDLNNKAEVFNSADNTLKEASLEDDAPTFHTATSLGGDGGLRFLVAGGYRKVSESVVGPQSVASIYELGADLNSLATSPAGDMETPRAMHVATLLNNGSVAVTGGMKNCDTGTATDAIEIYEPDEAAGAFLPATGYEEVALKMSPPRFGHTATLLEDGTLLIAGGFSETAEGKSVSGESLRSIDIYSPLIGE